MTSPAIERDFDFDLVAGQRVAVIAPHPDDEVFAVGGVMSMLSARGCLIEILAVTDGEASHAKSTCVTPAELRATREQESWAAYRLLGLSPAVHRLGLPDSRVADCLAALRMHLRERLVGVSLVLAPIDTDGHPDHDATGTIAAEVASDFGIPLVRYAVWARLNPERIVQGPPRPFPLSAGVLARKQAAIRVYKSQLHPLGPLPEDGPVLPEGFLDHFSEECELLWPAM